LRASFRWRQSRHEINSQLVPFAAHYRSIQLIRE